MVQEEIDHQDRVIKLYSYQVNPASGLLDVLELPHLRYQNSLSTLEVVVKVQFYCTLSAVPAVINVITSISVFIKQIGYD
ncbi:hypothetical protein VIN01S_27960 [Vibrio inusitatus NBRC 102082]|uniref:Uncharacterized protein n=1 Tax=Vibrio inusitatus NBRC 102082 TaxID=1219070 RepID=A0A4Y3HZH9_9VIBR|nr:hypothetical protein VIN01S_27960 [Vibrio inusitatus NBRC 102082]